MHARRIRHRLQQCVGIQLRRTMRWCQSMPHRVLLPALLVIIMAASSTSAYGRCLKGMPGICIDVRSKLCVPAVALNSKAGGYCGNNPNIECCQSGRSQPAQPAQQQAWCSKGNPGICIDVNTEVCVGARTIASYCVGSSNIECCPGYPSAPSIEPKDIDFIPLVKSNAGVAASSSLDDKFWDNRCGNIPPEAVAVAVRMGSVRDPIVTLQEPCSMSLARRMLLLELLLCKMINLTMLE